MSVWTQAVSGAARIAAERPATDPRLQEAYTKALSGDVAALRYLCIRGGVETVQPTWGTAVQPGALGVDIPGYGNVSVDYNEVTRLEAAARCLAAKASRTRTVTTAPSSTETSPGTPGETGTAPPEANAPEGVSSGPLTAISGDAGRAIALVGLVALVAWYWQSTRKAA